MNSADVLRKLADERLMVAWGCKSARELAEKKREVIEEVRRRNPDFFSLDGPRRKAIEWLCAQSGLTVEAQLEQMAFESFLMLKAVEKAPKLSEDEIAEIDKLIDEDNSKNEKG